MSWDILFNRINEGLKMFSKLLKRAFVEFKSNDPLRMAGATAFFTTFALPPILLIIVQLFGLITDKRTFAVNIMQRLTEIIGEESVLLIRETLRNVRSLSENWYVTVIGFIILMFIATTLFVVIKNSLDQIWCIKVKRRVGIVFRLKQRARSFAIIMFAGLLFSTGLIIEAIRTFFGQYVDILNPSLTNYFNSALNEFLFAIIVMLWFIVVFRFIGNGRPSWRTSAWGGLFTAVLFTAGKLTIRFFLMRSNIQLIYTTSGSFVLILLFVFYSSMIFYYGGCFVKVLSEHLRDPIHPIEGAYKYKLQEIRS